MFDGFPETTECVLVIFCTISAIKFICQTPISVLFQFFKKIKDKELNIIIVGAERSFL